MTRVAVIGAGVSGLVAAYHLSRHMETVVFEKDQRLGGHADTEVVMQGQSETPVDTGFIVFNEAHYPRFTRILSTLGVPSKPSNMSFSVVNEDSRLEYNPETVNSLFGQRRNLFRPSFYRLLKGILRFYRSEKSLLDLNSDLTVGDYLASHGYPDEFGRDHLYPIIAALWSARDERVEEFPIVHLVQFMANHQMFRLWDRPTWRTIDGGSTRYVTALTEAIDGEFRTGTEVRSVRRVGDSVMVSAAGAEPERFSAVVIATHSDQALKILSDADSDEQRALAAIDYQSNDIALHSDVSVMPRRQHCWASWNVRAKSCQESERRAQVTYWMNRLQTLETPEPLFVSLNQTHRIDHRKLHCIKQYDHPVFTQASLKAQETLKQLSGRRNTYFCGAYHGWGFHEDGVASGEIAAQKLIAATGTVNPAIGVAV